MRTIEQFLRDDAGLETVEYAIITGIVVAGVIAAITALGIWLSNHFVSSPPTLGA